MLGYYLFVCTIYVLLVVLVGSLLFHSYDIHVVDYDSYQFLFNMLYVLWLVMFSNLCRGA